MSKIFQHKSSSLQAFLSLNPINLLWKPFFLLQTIHVHKMANKKVLNLTSLIAFSVFLSSISIQL